MWFHSVGLLCTLQIFIFTFIQYNISRLSRFHKVNDSLILTPPILQRQIRCSIINGPSTRISDNSRRRCTSLFSFPKAARKDNLCRSSNAFSFVFTASAIGTSASACTNGSPPEKVTPYSRGLEKICFRIVFTSAICPPEGSWVSGLWHPPAVMRTPLRKDHIPDAGTIHDGILNDPGNLQLFRIRYA